MAARRRTQNIRELREQFDAAERRKAEDEEPDEEEDEDEADEEEEEDEEAVEAEEEAEEGEGEDEEAEPKPKPKPKKAKKKPVAEKPVKPKRSRAGKVVRMRVVWGVFNNSNQRVATYDYGHKAQADEHATRLQGEKKQTFFVQPVKEPIEEK
jgi:cobalamin biosynthesis protein CobT